MIEDIKYLCNEVIIIKSGQILKVAHSNEIASLASGRVYKIPERELSNLKSPFYIENYLIRDNEKNEKIVKVLLLGQDPYHNEHQAHGLSFSVQPGQDIPPSLVNIYKELHDDLGCYIPNNGYLKKWADQGVLLLNTVLTVRAHQANSHQGHGWEQFTDAVIQAVNSQDRPIVYMLWGAPARRKKAMLTNPKHLILEAPHPSPLSAYRGFFGCKHFSKANEFLKASGVEPIDWQIENI